MKQPTLACTCTDQRCPAHPSNHEYGCTPCVEKNLRRGEIPSCFFKAVDPQTKPPAYYFKNFADHVLQADKDKA